MIHIELVWNSRVLLEHESAFIPRAGEVFELRGGAEYYVLKVSYIVNANNQQLEKVRVVVR